MILIDSNGFWLHLKLFRPLCDLVSRPPRPRPTILRARSQTPPGTSIHRENRWKLEVITTTLEGNITPLPPISSSPARSIAEDANADSPIP